MMDDSSRPRRLTRAQLATLFVSRLVLFAIYRVAYPLIPFLAEQFGVPVEEASLLITVLVGIGVTSLIGGWLADRVGYRTMMVVGLGGAAIGTLCVAVAPTLGIMIVAYSICGIGSSLHRPAMQAYIGEFSPPHERGRAIGLVELSWSLTGIVAVPPLMRLIETQQSLTGVFIILAGSLAVVTLLTWTQLTPAGLQAADRTTPQSGSYLRAVMCNPRVLGMVSFLILGIGGIEVLFIAQAPWATERFGASLGDLGTAALVFGLGELGGSLASTLLTDRLGKRRAAIGAFVLAAVIYLALPALSVNWISYLVCYALLALAIEFAIVAALTLATTVSSTGRATVMALSVTAMQIGRVVGSAVGVRVLVASSIYVNGLTAVVMTLLGVGIALRYVHEGEPTQSPRQKQEADWG